MSVLLIIGVATWAGAIVLLVALCRNAACGDGVQVLPSAEAAARLCTSPPPRSRPRRVSRR